MQKKGDEMVRVYVIINSAGSDSSFCGPVYENKERAKRECERLNQEVHGRYESDIYDVAERVVIKGRK